MSDDVTLISELHGLIQHGIAGFETSWLDIVTDLLNFCDRYQPDDVAWAGVPPAIVDSVITRIEADVCKLLDAQLPSAAPREGQLTSLLEVIGTYLAGAGSFNLSFLTVIIARGIAGGIDTAYGKELFLWFRNGEDLDIRPGMIYPVSPRNPTRLVGPDNPINSKPWDAPSRRFDRLAHFRLASERFESYRLLLDFSLDGQLAALGSSLDPAAAIDGENGPEFRIVAAQPNLSLSEFRVEETENTFRNKGPVDEQAQLRHIISILRSAASAEVGASIVVIPEYSLVDSQREAIMDVIGRLPNPPELVVAGSCEVFDPTAKGNRNEAWLYLPTSDQDDAVPRVLPNVEEDSPGSWEGVKSLARGVSRRVAKHLPAHISGSLEDILPGLKLPIFWTKAFTFTVLICRDAMSTELVELLAEVGVDLLLVPAFSEKIGTIVGNTAVLSTTNQAFVVVACAPAVWSWDPVAEDQDRSGSGRDEAAFSGPYEHDVGPLTVPSHDSGPVAGRGMWVFGARSRTATWYRCNS